MRAIIGTAGHIDHGKTALVRALTGIDTDRLPEERNRGISIELGFAYLDLPGGDRAGIVDVPGHERFIRQMLAGAQGFDLLLLVVAADDGVMPQTEEHFEICHLLGVRQAIFVITKIDLVGGDRVDEVRGEIEILAAGTAFERAPVHAVSAQRGDGIDELRREIVERLARAERRPQLGPFRLPVDRAFVVKGHGVVVTGTAAGGGVAPGDELMIVPGERVVRVREVQVHERRVESAEAGQRVALNLAGVERGEIRRGDCLVSAGVRAQTRRFDARVEIRPSARKAVRSHQRVRLYLGTSERLGRIVWLDGLRSVEPRASAYAQISVDEEVVAFVGDRFILRDETACYTLGGGHVLVARAAKHASGETVASKLDKISGDDCTGRIVGFVGATPGLGLAPADAAMELGLAEADVRALAMETAELCLLPSAENPALLASASRCRRWKQAVVDRVRQHHDAHPTSTGIEFERLASLREVRGDERGLRWLIETMITEGDLVRRGGRVALPDHRPSVEQADAELAGQVRDAICGGGTMPPTLKELSERLSVPIRKLSEIVTVLCDHGEVVKVSSELVFSRQVLDEVEAKLRAELVERERITAAEFRDLIGATRKYCIPLLDYLDRSGVTVRQGDYRRLRSP